MYAIIDIETTGGMARSEKITEIAVFLFDGENIVDEFTSLVNPERTIPYHITNLTGITNEMVANAPKFYEIAKKIIEITENATFVAHNVSFDYSFVKEEFKSLGYNFHRPKLCTVKLSRKLLPGFPSYSLGNLCKSLGISLYDRHRASGDAAATVELFKLLLEKNKDGNQIIDLNFGNNLKGLHPKLTKEVLQKIPEETGVYYFYNEKNDLIYVGKSKNLYKRVLTHLSNEKSRRSIEMKSNIAHIDIEVTGSELIALLLESDEIKRNKPLYNRAQRRSAQSVGLYYFKDKEGYINFCINKNSDTDKVPLISFNSQGQARETLHKHTEEFELCQKLCGLYHSAGACFYYGLKECKGACTGQETSDEYNIRAQQLITRYSYSQSSFFIMEKGRSNTENGIVKIANGKYVGFGFVKMNEVSINNVDGLNDYIKKYQDNRDTKMIIKAYIQKNKPMVITC